MWKRHFRLAARSSHDTGPQKSVRSVQLSLIDLTSLSNLLSILKIHKNIKENSYKFLCKIKLNAGKVENGVDEYIAALKH